MERTYNLKIFDEGGASGTQQAPATPPAQPAGTQPAAQTAGGYSFSQAEEIATARAERAEKAALASYFKQQGLSEDEATEAIKAYKAAQDAKKPNVDALTRERDEARAELDAMKQEKGLTAKGVKPEDVDYVSFKVRAMMKQDTKLTFELAADKYLKENPRYAGRTYRTKATDDKDKTGGTAGKSSNAALNAAIRAAARR